MPTIFNIIFEDKEGRGQSLLTWELSCTRPKQRTQFQGLLNAGWSKLFQSDLHITEF